MSCCHTKWRFHCVGMDLFNFLECRDVTRKHMFRKKEPIYRIPMEFLLSISAFSRPFHCIFTALSIHVRGFHGVCTALSVFKPQCHSKNAIHAMDDHSTYKTSLNSKQQLTKIRWHTGHKTVTLYAIFE